ncbi:hypothetical protein AAMO2058_001263200 [Amorphochlora amoebiformis]
MADTKESNPQAGQKRPEPPVTDPEGSRKSFKVEGDNKAEKKDSKEGENVIFGKVEQNDKSSQFELYTLNKEGQKKERAAYVVYVLNEKDKTLDLQHTVTTKKYRGKGLAGRVVKASFDFAITKGLKVIPTCTYIPVFVRKNPQYKNILVKSKM